MARPDLYVSVHKGLRSMLFDSARLVARTDMSDDAEAARAIAAVRNLLSHLDEHAEKEDHVILPEIERLGAGVFADLQADHSRVGGMQHEIEALLELLAGSSGEERLSLGRRLYEKINRLTAEHLLHMEREETTASRLLWAHLTDEQLLALHARILSSIPPERMARWAEIILPAVTPGERAAMLGGMAKAMPPEALERVRELVGQSVRA